MDQINTENVLRVIHSSAEPFQFNSGLFSMISLILQIESVFNLFEMISCQSEGARLQREMKAYMSAIKGDKFIPSPHSFPVLCVDQQLDHSASFLCV